MLEIDCQCADGVSVDAIPSADDIAAAVNAAWSVATLDDTLDAATLSAWQQAESLQLCLRVVAPPESQDINRTWRQRDKPTNVLSFPEPAIAGLPPELPRSLGDIVVCADIVAAEAEAGGIGLDARWAHMLVHGCLHLLGYDHIDDEDAEHMMRVEREALAELGFADPYVRH